MNKYLSSYIMNIVDNGGFETGSFPPWTLSISPDPSTFVGHDKPHSGRYEANLGYPFQGLQTLSQTLTTIPGTTYTLSYWLAATAIFESKGSSFFALWDSNPILGSFVMNPGTTYINYTFSVTATTASTTLSFSFRTIVAESFYYLDDVSVISPPAPPVICYSGESIVLTQNRKSKEIKELSAKEVIAGIHTVFDVDENIFVPVKCNVITGPTNRYMLLKKDALGENKPNEDFYVTSGHKIIYNGVEVKARHIPEAVRIKVQPEPVYSICTDKKRTIMVNGLPVTTWCFKKWLRYSAKNCLVWKDNKVDANTKVQV